MPEFRTSGEALGKRKIRVLEKSQYATILRKGQTEKPRNIYNSCPGLFMRKKGGGKRTDP